MSTQVYKNKIEFIGKISKFTGNRKVICIPNYVLEKLSDIDFTKHFTIKIEEY
jgi:hypothetical protein